MTRPPRHNHIALALYINAVVLIVILVTLLSQNRLPEVLPAAYAQQQMPIAGGAGVFIMPAQFSTNTWGCYLLDADAQTLCAYQFLPGEKLLRLVASRNFKFDRRLGNFNTAPSPLEVGKLVEKEQENARTGKPPASATDEPAR